MDVFTHQAWVAFWAQLLRPLVLVAIAAATCGAVVAAAASLPARGTLAVGPRLVSAALYRLASRPSSPPAEIPRRFKARSAAGDNNPFVR
jgi:hypothetical protein